MLDSLNRESNEPLYLQIRDRFRDLILSGDLPAGSRLPPQRELAASLGVNRTTVSSAYDELAADGLVEGHVGRGTIVCSKAGDDGSGLADLFPQPLAWNEYFVGGQARDSLIRDLVALCAREDVISLAGGLPAPDLYPVERFAQTVRCRRNGCVPERRERTGLDAIRLRHQSIAP
jgi:DNA-binding transcriptional MocR family regulator